MSKPPSRSQASWDVEKGDYYYPKGSHVSQRAAKIEKNWDGSATITYENGSSETIAKYGDADLDTWDE